MEELNIAQFAEKSELIITIGYPDTWPKRLMKTQRSGRKPGYVKSIIKNGTIYLPQI